MELQVHIKETALVESELVTSLKGGCETSFTSLYNKYARKIYHVSRKTGLEHEEAEGVVQEVFIKIWRNRSSLDPSLSFGAYLLTIAKSMVIKSFRKKAHEIAYQQYALSSLSPSTNNTEDYVIFRDLDELSAKMMHELSDRQKQVFMMKNIQHLTTEEIAIKLNISKRTVENQIYRATKLLKEKLIFHIITALALSIS